MKHPFLIILLGLFAGATPYAKTAEAPPQPATAATQAAQREQALPVSVRAAVESATSWQDLDSITSGISSDNACEQPPVLLIIAMHHRLAVNRSAEAWAFAKCLDGARASPDWSSTRAGFGLPAFLAADSDARAGRIASAIERFEEVADQFAWLTPAALIAAATLQHRLDPIAALPLAQAAVSRNELGIEPFADVYFTLGMLELSDARFDEAKQLFEKSWTVDPSHPLARAAFVAADLRMQAVAEQPDAFFEALAQDPPSRLLDHAVVLVTSHEATSGRVGFTNITDYSKQALGFGGLFGSSEISSSITQGVGGMSLNMTEGQNLTQTREGDLPIDFTLYRTEVSQ